MKVKEAYQNVLSIILDEPNLTLKEVKVEQVVLNKSGKRAIRLDAWAQDTKNRQFDMEMQNDAGADNLRRRSRFYQSLIDAPILKSGKKTRYRHLPSTVIIFITQEDLFGKDLAMYTFREWCQEVPKLPLNDGTCKIFLNMTSKRGRAELVSLLQYMKNSNLNNAEISVKDQRILDLDKVVREVKESEEWEDVKMNILEIGLERGKELGLELGISQGLSQGLEQGILQGIEQGLEQGRIKGLEQGLEQGRVQGLEQGRVQGLEQGLEQGRVQGLEQGRLKTLVQNVESAMKNFNVTLPQACAGLEISVAEYKKAKELISSWE